MTLQELYASVGGNYESALRILQMDKLITKFIARLPQDQSFAKLMDAWKARSSSGMFEAAHALKGVSANLGLNSLSELASAVAEEFRPGKSRTMADEQLDSHMEQLRAKYEETVAAIQKFTQG